EIASLDPIKVSGAEAGIDIAKSSANNPSCNLSRLGAIVSCRAPDFVFRRARNARPSQSDQIGHGSFAGRQTGGDSRQTRQDSSSRGMFVVVPEHGPDAV